jgi:hypothetical protein
LIWIWLRGHTLGRVGGGRVRAGLGSSSAGGSASRGGLGGRGTVATPEVGAVAGLLAVGVLLGVGGRPGALGAGGDTAVGVVGLVVAGAGNVPALGDAAGVCGFTYNRSLVRLEGWSSTYITYTA